MQSHTDGRPDATGSPSGDGAPRIGGDEPPLDAVRDDEGRPIRFHPYRPAVRPALVAMYARFDPTERAQGIPPVRPAGIEDWLDAVLAGPSMVAWHRDRVVGHVAFVPDGEGSHELAVFVHQDYQEAGVGSALLPAALDYARTAGVTDVWLTVAGGNTRARRLYRAAGFTRDDATGGALRLSRTL
ncbi:GNAT family N-acetyltransferase [Haloglomus litoreum]|uniref:GNAT family N-acetyltransferase n=1 Tax=Haloglomus litoreum TaxID=3034026 RepID=UPI0023E7A4E8|nr:GNAT family N-acetyltransferase [Haloglomus sp. DT116]